MRKQEYLKQLSGDRNTNSYKYYTTAKDDIDPIILPLVKVLNNPITVTLFSCEGHFAVRRDPQILFGVLPDRRKQWNTLLRMFLETVYAEHSVHYATIFRRYHPKTYGTRDKKPRRDFVDWQLVVRIPDDAFRSRRVFTRYRNEKVEGCTRLFRYLVRRAL